VSDKVATHRAAAARHEQAADTHDRAAHFWAGQGDPGRAELQREMADYERQGAVLERRWGKLVEPAPPSASAAESIRRQVRENAQSLADCLSRTATLLEESATLAEEQSVRTNIPAERAAKEARVAQSARQAAERARDQAGEWSRLLDSQA
jgi:hypothetical protein